MLKELRATEDQIAQESVQKITKSEKTVSLREALDRADPKELEQLVREAEQEETCLLNGGKPSIWL